MGNRLGVLGVGLLVSVFGAALGCESAEDKPQGEPSKGGSGGNAGKAGAGGMALSSSGKGGESGGSGGSAGAVPEGGSGEGGSGEGALSNDAFSPDVPEEYVGTIVDPGLEVIAHTAHEAVLGTEWLMAVKNTGTLYLCAIDVQFTFLDASNAELGNGSGLLDVPIVRGCNGTCGFTTCLGPGQIGMLVDQFALSDIDVTKIAKVTHAFGAINLIDAAPTTEIKVTGVMAVPGDFGGNVFSGVLENDAPDGVKNPSVNIYGLNSAGRPLFASKAIELTTIPAGGSWPFKTTGKFEEVYATTAAYPDVSDL